MLNNIAYHIVGHIKWTMSQKTLTSGLTINSEMFVRILFLQIALKGIFATLKICD